MSLKLRQDTKESGKAFIKMAETISASLFTNVLIL
jgi:hypothetical protein